jgi:hypothetical protein
MLPLADFLAGALLSLLLPVALLIGLVVWYLKFIRRVPETPEPELPGAPANPGREAPAAAGPPASDG